MNNKYCLLSAILICGLLATACSEKELKALQDENSAQKERITQLELELDEIMNGPERLIAQIQNAMDAKDYQMVITVANNLIKRHPGINESVQAQKFSDEATKQIALAEAEKKRQKEAEEQRVLNSITKIHDDVEGITWYYDKTVRNMDAPKMYFYFGKHDDRGTQTYLRIVIDHTYSSRNSWLFINEYIFNIDGNRFNFKPEYSEIKRDNGYSLVWEIIDKPLTDNVILTEIANAIINSQKATLRVSGDRYSDRDISLREKME
jgi:hypothetical protein